MLLKSLALASFLFSGFTAFASTLCTSPAGIDPDFYKITMSSDSRSGLIEFRSGVPGSEEVIQGTLNLALTNANFSVYEYEGSNNSGQSVSVRLNATGTERFAVADFTLVTKSGGTLVPTGFMNCTN